MPLYDYKCDACDFTREVMHGMNETPQVSCPNDGCEWPMVRQVGASSFRLKGEGFFATGFHHVKTK